MKSIMVTGGCGMIGSNLVKRLVKEGWDGIASGIERLIDNVALKENIHKYLISHEYGNSKEIGRYYSMFDN